MASGVELLGQGAEARLFAASFRGLPCVIKERFSKAYRHPTLDVRITLERLTTEARCMLRARRAGVDAPVLYLVDHSAFWGPIGSRLKKDFRLINDEAMQSLSRQLGAGSAVQPDAKGGAPSRVDAATVAPGAVDAVSVGVDAATAASAVEGTGTSGSAMAVELDKQADGTDSSRPADSDIAATGAAVIAGSGATAASAAAAATALTAAIAVAIASLPPAGGPRIVMERVHGVTVKAFLDSALVRPSDRALLAQDVGLAIARLHDGGIIHGDLTTSNVMVRGLPHPRGVDVLTAAPRQDADVASEATAGAAVGSEQTGPAGSTTSSLASPSSARISEPLSASKSAATDDQLGATSLVAAAHADGSFTATEPGPEGSSGAATAHPTSAASSVASRAVLAGAAADSDSSAAPPTPVPVSLHLHFPVVIIDYGLASMSAAAEEKAVDLYVLERAILSAHSTPEEEEEEEAGVDDEGEDGEEDRESEGGGDDASAGALALRRGGAPDGSGSSTSAGPFRVHPNPPSSCKGPAFASSAGAGRDSRAAAGAVATDVTTAAGFFAAVLASYLAAVRDSREIGRRYEIVRRRGRKRLAFG